jgi:hypothetical protein
MPTPLTWNAPGMTWDMPGLTWNGMVPETTTPNPPQHMAQQNIASTRITAAKVTELRTHLQAALAVLKEIGVALTPAQRSALPTIGQENSMMVTNGVALVRDNPTWFPADFDRAELLADAEDLANFRQAESVGKEFIELYRDTAHAIGSDNIMGVYAASPYIIQGAKLSGMNNDTVNQFRAFFKRGRRSTPTPPPA